MVGSVYTPTLLQHLRHERHNCCFFVSFVLAGLDAALAVFFMIGYYTQCLIRIAKSTLIKKGPLQCRRPFEFTSVSYCFTTLIALGPLGPFSVS